MVTGDYHYTAVAVAKGAGMIRPHGKLVIIQAASEASAADAFLKSVPKHPKAAVSCFSTPGQSQHVTFGDLERRLAALASLQHSAITEESHQGGPCALPPVQMTEHAMKPPPLHGRQQPSIFTKQLLLQRSANSRHMCSHVLATDRCNMLLSQTHGGQQQGILQLACDQQPPVQLPQSLLTPYELQRSQHCVKLAHAPDHDLPIPGIQQQSQIRGLTAGLLFLTEGYSPGQEPQTALDCVHSIAQGEVQCCVTGPAFEQLLQHAEPALLECVMRHAVVFARMKSQQKGQVVELLSHRGLHQMVQGQEHHIPVSLAIGMCTRLVRWSCLWMVHSSKCVPHMESTKVWQRDAISINMYFTCTIVFLSSVHALPCVWCISSTMCCVACTRMKIVHKCMPATTTATRHHSSLTSDCLCLPVPNQPFPITLSLENAFKHVQDSTVCETTMQSQELLPCHCARSGLTPTALLPPVP